MKKNLRKLLCLILCMSMVMGLLTACKTEETKTDNQVKTDTVAKNDDKSDDNTDDKANDANESNADSIYAGIEPLATPTELNFGYLTGSHHGMVIYMIDKLGGFEQVGITANIEAFGNGPVMVEAMASDSWDCGTIGLGGVLTGVISQEMLIIGAAARDFDSLRIFAKNDSDIIAAGKTLADYPNIYGTAELWKGKEILLPTGSTLHYVLSTGLSKFGLSDTDVAMTHMDVTSVNTALRANKGEIGAVWGSFTYAEALNEDYTVVMSANDLGIELPTVMCANPRSYNDPEKYTAIKKWMELYFATVDWIYSNDENFNKTVEMFTEINEEAGATGTLEENTIVLKYNQHYSLEDNVKFFNEKTEDGTMLQIEGMHYDPLVFYIKNGSYKEGDDTKLLGGYFKADIINELAAAAK